MQTFAAIPSKVSIVGQTEFSPHSLQCRLPEEGTRSLSRTFRKISLRIGPEITSIVLNLGQKATLEAMLEQMAA